VKRRSAPLILVFLAGLLAMLALNWPGQMSYDSVAQLAEARAGFYHSWHPPVMAWLMGLFDSLIAGTGLFVLFNGAMALFAFYTFAQPRRATGLTLLLALLAMLSPQWLLYQGIVWKDVLFADAALAGFAALARAARGNPLWYPPALLLLALAMMTRQNGLVIVPAAAIGMAALLRRRMTPRQAVGAALLFAGLVMGVAFGGEALLARRGDRGADAADEIRVAQSYDLAGMMARDPGLRPARLEAEAPALARLLRTRGAALYTPVWIDPLMNDPALHTAIDAAPPGLIFAQWRDALLRHPGLYLATRWTAFAWVLGTPDRQACHALFTGVDGDPRLMAALGLKHTWRPQDRLHDRYGRWLRGTPLFSHLLFGALALILLAFLLWRRHDMDLMASGLLGAALAFTASFFVVSIACDYRYLYFLDLAAMTGALAAAARGPAGRDANRPGMLHRLSGDLA
jgi:hypothetical protein